MSLISKLSKNSSSIKEYKTEHKQAYWILYVFKAVISVFSIVTAYLYLHTLLIPFVGGFLAHIFTFIGLVLIEVSGVLLYNRVAKYTIRKRFFNAIIYFSFAVLIFGASFILSTNGIAQLTTEKISNIAEISENESIEIETNTKESLGQIAETKAAIELIKKNPVNWYKGSRSKLSSEQLNQISILNGQIYEIRAKQAKDLESIKFRFKALKDADNKQTTGTAKNYYFIVGILLFIQLLASFVLVYMSIKVYAIDDTKSKILEDIKAYRDNLLLSVRNTVVNESKVLTTFIGEQLQLQSIMQDVPEIESFTMQENSNEKVIPGEQNKNKVPGTELPPKIEQPKHKPVRGFQMSNARNTDIKIDDERIDDERIDGNSISIDSGLRVCKHCNSEFTHKHWNKRYCSDACRKAAWEQRTGKKLILKSKNK